LHEALASRTTIGQAQGILMHAFDINSDRAFAYMQRLSQDGNIKLFEIAEQIVHNRTALRRGEDETTR
ncbi:MAG: ANTAR domain-containing protein, partial [Aeromicrobium sp.]